MRVGTCRFKDPAAGLQGLLATWCHIPNKKQVCMLNATGLAAPLEEAVFSCCQRLDMWLRSCDACLDAASARLRSRSACLGIRMKHVRQQLLTCIAAQVQHAKERCATYAHACVDADLREDWTLSNTSQRTVSGAVSLCVLLAELLSAVQAADQACLLPGGVPHSRGVRCQW
jgi:hypothetical protein